MRYAGDAYLDQQIETAPNETRDLGMGLDECIYDSSE